MNIEDMNKRKQLLETNFKTISDRIKVDTENALRVQGALINLNELIADEEKKEKELKDKVEKKKVK